ncbi:MAG: hypothetical protein ACNA7V_13510, partial [Bacteroidales bacterium]
ETALVRKSYAGWCGGTAARAASYPINKLKYRRANIPSHPGRNFSFWLLPYPYAIPNGIATFA